MFEHHAESVMISQESILFIANTCVGCPRVCVCVCFLPIHSGHQWTYQPGSHRRKVTQDF